MSISYKNAIMIHIKEIAEIKVGCTKDRLIEIRKSLNTTSDLMNFYSEDVYYKLLDSCIDYIYRQLNKQMLDSEKG